MELTDKEIGHLLFVLESYSSVVRRKRASGEFFKWRADKILKDCSALSAKLYAEEMRRTEENSFGRV